MNIDVSLVVCTRNRAEALHLCLDAIARLNFRGNWELVVVDNGSTDDTREKIDAFAQTANFPVKYVYLGKPGLGRARNAGISETSGEIIAFTDDDCYVDPDFLTEICNAFSEVDVGYTSGRIRLYDPEDYPVTINESLDPQVFPPNTFVAAGGIQGANMAIRREVLDQVKGFDARFGSGALFPSEDCEMACRASNFGWKGRYVPEIVVWHHHGRKAADVPKLRKSYAIGRGAYHMKLLSMEGTRLHGIKAWLLLFRDRIFEWPGNFLYEIQGAAKFIFSSPES